MNIQARAGCYVYISVTDSGTGIPQTNINQIFDPFFTTKELTKGTGLGLSTVTAIVKSHEGIVNVYSELGKGTTFEVYLPAIQNASNATQKETSRIVMPRGNGEKILVVDDETAILTITSQTLEAFGYRVATAQDGAKALAIYAESKDDIAVVITDMMMPIMDGTSLIRVLLHINPAIKIIGASGYSANYSTSGVLEVGVTHFLTKPYTAEILLKTLHAIIQEA
jgi:CheY-like chemotaxis protein